MKNIIKPLTILTLLTIMIVACDPVEYGEIGTPFSKTEAIEGTWGLTEIVQVDEAAREQGGMYTELDLTNAFNFTDYTITFTLDTDTLPLEFSIDPGMAPNFIDTLGTWTFDDNDFPTEVLFTQSDSVNVTSKLKLIAPPRDQNPLRVKYQRYSGGNLIISYQYSFEKLTQ